jgi:hypothetical protein
MLEGVLKDVVEHEGHSFGWGHGFQHDQKRHRNRLVKACALGGIDLFLRLALTGPQSRR